MRINSNAGNAIKKAVTLNKSNSSLKISQAAKIGMNKESRWAASVFTIPICFIEAAKKRKTEGNKIPKAV
ncbi:hypothetical protein D3C80_1546590 [compost metagenome]